MSLEQLKPDAVWQFFEEICKIPRPSKHEEKIIAYLIDFARQRNLEYKKDKTGNLLISKPAPAGSSKKKTVILQGHVDMVGEKHGDVDHDFHKDPIIPLVENGWVIAEGTTLGADDGIAVAAMMAILDAKDIEHGPLECLFTVDEESGLTGAKQMETGFITGKTLINLDSEDEGELFIGCAGGVDTLGYLPFKYRPVPSHSKAYKIKINGLRGGHSGDEIHLGLGNSVKITDRFLWNASRAYGIKLASLQGGNMRNAIPREATANFVVKEAHAANLEDFFKSFSKTVKEEYKSVESGLELILENTGLPDAVINKNAQKKLLYLLYALPHGVIAWSREIENLVETSTNLSTVEMNKDQYFLITTSQRSSVESAKKDIASRMTATFEMAGAKALQTDGYPGWKPNRSSEIVKITEQTYKDLFKEDPKVRAIHAGLECGLFLEKYPDLDMISFGPEIKGAHTPDERLDIESTERFWKLLLEVLRRLD